MATFTQNASYPKADKYQLVLTVTESSTSIPDNTSLVSYTLALKSLTAYGFSQFGIGWSIKLGGVTVMSHPRTYGEYTLGWNSTLTLGTGTATIAHNADGTKNLTCEANIDMEGPYDSYGAGPIALSGSMALTTIPRASSMTFGDFIMGTAGTLHITRASDEFLHTVTYTFGSASGTAVSDTAQLNPSWTPPVTLAQQIPNAVTGTGTLVLHTWKDGVEIGSKSYSFTASVPASVVPTVSIASVTDPTAYKAVYGGYVQTKSKAKVTLSASGAQGSSIASASVTVGTSTYSGTVITSAILNTPGYITISARVVDSRGRSGTASQTIFVQRYDIPSVSDVSVYRCNVRGTPDENGAYIRFYAKMSISALSGYNTGALRWSYQPVGGSAVTGSLTSGVASIVGGSLSAQTSYTCKITAVDSLGNTAGVEVVVPTASVTLHLRDGGKAVGLGMYAQGDNALDIASDWTIRKGGERSMANIGYTISGSEVQGVINGVNVYPNVGYVRKEIPCQYTYQQRPIIATRYGKVCTILIDGCVVPASDTETKLVTLPDDFVPRRTESMDYYFQGNTIRVFALPSKEITVYVYGGNGSFNAAIRLVYII